MKGDGSQGSAIHILDEEESVGSSWGLIHCQQKCTFLTTQMIGVCSGLLMDLVHG
jgi:hypothetical protein